MPPRDVLGLTCDRDILPTLAELCGLSPPPSSLRDGVSLADPLHGRGEPPADRTLVVQFSRMDHQKPTRGDACVLWRRWRLVGNEALYNLETDPAQETDVAVDHPEIVERLRAHYDRWWTEVVPHVNEPQAVVIGADAENPTRLSPADWRDAFLDIGRQVRQGERRNGVWHLEVERPGDYEVTLRRWPGSVDDPFAAGLPAAPHADGVFPAGVALPVAAVRLAVGDFNAVRDVGPQDAAATFTVSLPAGPSRLQTWLLDADGGAIAGAYYVSVRRR